MKEFTELRTELNEGVEDLVEHATMPPNILILRRRTVRQFADGVYVALYYNDKLGLQFSIPYGASTEPVITPVALKEAEKKSLAELIADQEAKDKATREYHKAREKKQGQLKEETSQEAETKRHEKNEKTWAGRKKRWGDWKAQQAAKAPKNLKEEVLTEDHRVGDTVRYRLGSEGHLRIGKVKQVTTEHLVVDRGGFHYKVPAHTIVHNERTGYTNKEDKPLEESAIEHLRQVRSFKTSKSLKHDDGTQTKVDPTTANALLTVHDSLSGENKEKFARMVAHSKPRFHKMLDFTWKHVK